MNKWLYRAVGVASGALLLSGGVAHAHAAGEAKPTVDPQAMRGLLADLFTPTGGLHHLGLSIDTPTAFAAKTPTEADIFGSALVPDVTSALPQPESHREELLPGLGLLGGAAGNGGLLGGLTGGTGGKGLVGTLTGGLTNGLASGKGGLLGGLTGGEGPLGGLTSGLTGGLTGGLAGGDGPLGDITSGLASTPLGGPLAGLTNGLGAATDPADDFVDADAEEPVLDPALLQDLAAANGGRLGVDGPASTDIVDPVLRGTALDTTNQRPVLLDPAIARQVNDATAPLISDMIADAVAQKAGQLAAPAESFEEGLPLVGDVPVVGDLVGPKGPLSQFLVVGSLFDNLPVVGDLTRGGLDLGAVDRLPLAGKILNQGLVQAGDGPAIPVVGSLPIVGPALGTLTKPLASATANPLGSLTGGDGPLGSLTGGLTGGGGPLGGLTSGLTGGAGPLGSLTGGLTGGGSGPLGGLTGGLTGGGPLGGLTNGLTGGGGPLGGLTGGLTQPASTLPAPAPAKGPASSPINPASSLLPQAQPAPARADGQRPQPAVMAAGEPTHVGRHRAPTDTARPVVVDAEYRDMESLPLLSSPARGSLPLLSDPAMSTLPPLSDPAMGSLPLLSDSAMGSLPISGLVRQLPLVSELPLLGQLDAPLSIVKALPVIGSLAGLVPVN